MITEFCSKCKHRVGDNPPMCQHPDNGIEFTTGQVSLIPCRIARSKLSGFCGPSAALYEEASPVKLTWYQTVWAWLTGRL